MSNVLKFKSFKDTNLVFCIVDTTPYIVDSWIKEITKNQADYTLQNLCIKGYTVFQGTNEDQLLRDASECFEYACVLSTGTEFLNGEKCIDLILDECTDNFFVKGHILDRGDAYYELHAQCYLLNLKEYVKLGCPTVGKQELGVPHSKVKPIRSSENFHDDYTPIHISLGTELKTYNHKCHGWNFIQIGLENSKISPFNNDIRNNKKHLYPESPKDFYKNLSYVYFKERFCATEFVHKSHTEWFNKFIPNLRQVVAPASGEWYKEMLDTDNQCKVILYDYNPESLKYWRENVEYLPNVTYEFIYWDLLGNFYDITQHLDLELEDFTLVNLSNIFCYEGTSTLANTKFRLKKENELLDCLKNKIPNAWVNFSARTSAGFINADSCIQRIKETPMYTIQDFRAPTWRIQDWI
jgi:hypothetical protein